jgi:AraC-like DNA-binding protein
MEIKRDQLGIHVPHVLGADGAPVLICPPSWRGPLLERKTIPTRAECGAQATGMPVVIAAKHSPGKRWYRCNGQFREIPMVGPGVDLLGSRYERDAGRWECEPGGETIKFNLNSVVLERYLHEDAYRFDLATRYAVKDDQLVNSLFSLAAELEQGLPNGVLFAEGLSLSIIGWLDTHHRARSEPALTRIRTFSEKQKSRIQEYIGSHINADLSIETLASQVGINPALFSSLFRATFGATPHRYVMKARIANAAILLRTQPQRPIADIALATGFANQGHFSNTFKGFLKQTPLRWRTG